MHYSNWQCQVKSKRGWLERRSSFLFLVSQALGFFTNHRLRAADFKHVVSIGMHLFVFSCLCMENIVVSMRPVKWNVACNCTIHLECERLAIFLNVAWSTFNEEGFKIRSIIYIKCQLGKFSQALLIARLTTSRGARASSWGMQRAEHTRRANCIRIPPTSIALT